MSIKREAILRTALRLFAERGFLSTSTTLLAREAGVAEGTIFRHFSGKEEIFNQLLADLTSRIKADIEAEVQKRSPLNGLDEIILAVRVFLTFVRQHAYEFTLFFNDAPVWYKDKDSPTYRGIHGIYDYMNTFLAGNFERGLKDGSIKVGPDAGAAADIVGCTIVGMARAIHFGLVDDSDAHVKNLLEYLRMSMEK